MARAVLALLSGFFVLTLSRTIADPDLWGHVRFGGDLLLSGDLVRPDPYAYTSGAQPWINHEWLAEVLLYAAWAAFGGPGLVVLKVLVGLAVMGLVLRHLIRRGVPPVHAGIVTILAYPTLYVGLVTVRPHLFTYLGLVLVLLAMDAADRGRPGWLWTLPAVFAAWVNLHGGFLAGMAVLLVWTAAHGIGHARRAPAHPPRPPARTLVGAASLCLAATFANPYGPELWAFLLRTASVPRPEITEWSPVALLSLPGASYVLLLVVTTAALATASPPPAWPSRLVFAALAPLPLLATRHLPLFGLGALIVAAAPLAVLSRRIGTARADRRRPASRWIAAGLWAGAAVLLALAVPRFRGVRIEAAQQPLPVKAIALLEASGVHGNLAVDFDWGQYALWHLAPDVRVSVDGRRETVYDDAAYRMNLDFLFGVNAWDRLLTGHATDLALVSRKMPVYNLLRLAEPWEEVYADSLAGLFARAGSPQARALKATPAPDVPVDGDGRLFP